VRNLGAAYYFFMKKEALEVTVQFQATAKITSAKEVWNIIENDIFWKKFV